MEMLMQLQRPEFELDGINSGSWYHCLPVKIRGRLYSSCVKRVPGHEVDQRGLERGCAKRLPNT